MDVYVQAIILGVIQGITEFLPISSSGHLIVMPELFGWSQQGLIFDVAVHIATLAAVFVVLWNDILHIIQKQREMIVKIIVATIPAVIVGLGISGAYLDEIRTAGLVAVNLIVFGAILWFADWWQGKHLHKVQDASSASWKQVLIAGCAQAVALLPGVSRSGITISAGLFSGLDRVAAAKLSYVLGIPAIAGAGLLVSIDAYQSGEVIAWGPVLAGCLAAFLSGMIAISFLLKLVEKTSYGWFAGYRFLLAAVVLMWFI